MSTHRPVLEIHLASPAVGEQIQPHGGARAACAYPVGMWHPLSDDLVELQRRLLEFADGVIGPLARGADPESPPPGLRREIAAASEAAGFYRLALPERDGGAGADATTLTAAREALAMSGSPFAPMALGSGPGVLRLADNDRQRAELYEPALRGERAAAFAFTEAPGPDRTTARPVLLPGGEPGFRVTGAKAFVTGGQTADWLAVVAGVPPGEDEEAPEGGLALLVIDRGADGVIQGEAGATLDGSTHCAFRFEDAPVPRSRLLGKIGDGLPRAMDNIHRTRLRIAAEAAGSARFACRSTLERISGPHRSGSPLSEREQVRAIFADMALDAWQAQSAAYRAAAAADAGAADADAQIALAKWTATEALGRVVDRAIQLQGAQALLRGHPLERLYRASRSLRVAEGPTELLRLGIAKDLLDAGADAL